MALNEEAGTYYCFACGASGDQLSFMQEHEGLSFREAVEVLAERYDVPLTADFGRGGGGGAASKADDKRSRALLAHQLAAEFTARGCAPPTPRRAPRCCAGGTARARARSPTASASATRRAARAPPS